MTDLNGDCTVQEIMNVKSIYELTYPGFKTLGNMKHFRVFVSAF